MKKVFFFSLLILASLFSASVAKANNDDNLHMYSIACVVSSDECSCDFEMTVTGCINDGGIEGTYFFTTPIDTSREQTRAGVVEAFSGIKQSIYCRASDDEQSGISSIARQNLLIDGDQPITDDPATCNFTLFHTDFLDEAPVLRSSESSPGGDGSGGGADTSTVPTGGGASIEPVRLENPLGAGSTDIPQFIGRVTQNALGVLGSISLLVFVIGGFIWLTSAGKPERVKTGTNTMVYAAVGIFVIFGSYAILGAVLSAVGGSTGSNLDTQIESNSCEAAGEGFACRSIDSCGLSFSPTQSIEDKRSQCQRNPDMCRLNLCSGGDEIVCCQQ